MFIFTVITATATETAHTIGGIEFKLNSNYTLLTDKDLTADSTVDGLLFAVIANEGEHQIQTRCTVTEFSKELKSFIGLEPESIKPVGNIIFPEHYDITTFGSNIYLKQNSGNSVIYVTVADSKLFTFTYFGSDASVMGEFMSKVALPQPAGSSNLRLLIIVAICIFLIADIVLLVFLMLSFIKDHRRKKMEMEQNIVSNYIKIKRRKY